MVDIRPARWPEDEPRIRGVDTSFTSTRIYRVVRDGLDFQLREERVTPPIEKTYGVLRLRGGDGLFVAEGDAEIVGWAELRLEGWNRRGVIEHLYVSPGHRGHGIGTALVEALSSRAAHAQARCLWLETQNVNLPAVQFYRRIGFELCGLDETLYDPTTMPGEVALFFARPI